VIVGTVGGGAALRQLSLQRQQLADQTRVQEREQANAIDVSVGGVDGAQVWVLPPEQHELVHMANVANNSKRPIREVTCHIEGISADGKTRLKKDPDLYGQWVTTPVASGVKTDTFTPQAKTSTYPVLTAGSNVGFVFDVTAGEYPGLLAWVRFTDDAGLHWQIDTDLHLEKLKSRDW
jgi:hypothetical protein